MMLQKILTIITAAILSISLPLSGWAATGMTDDGLLNLDLKVFIAAKPISLILVEKNVHGLRLLRDDGRLKVAGEFRVALGENFGRKEKEGDEKTPEGIYFITRKYIDHKITVFGTKAFHLNYPNVFDTLAGRDGNGIYIHGTNKALRYNSTNGCVTLNDHDLSRLADSLKIGTMPIIIVPSLMELESDQTTLPDLTGSNFALAKKLLMPEGISTKVHFQNLYMLRVNEQTVVAGEYGENGHAGSFAASYIKFYPKKGWAVLERVPNFLAGEKTAQISTTPDKLEFIPTPSPIRATRNSDIPAPALWSWPSKEKDIYLSWYRDSQRHREKSRHLDKTAKRPVPGPAAKSKNFLYSLLLICFLLTGCLILAIIKIRRDANDRMRRAKTFIGVQSDDGGLGAEAQPRTVVIDNKVCRQQTENLQNDIKTLEQTIQTLHTHLEETRIMDKQELQTRINDLESSLQEKQAEIEQLITEKSALKLKGMSHLSDQVTELGVMRQDLCAAQEKLDESRQDLERLPMLEQMLAAEQEKSQQLAVQNAALQNNDTGECATLQTEITGLSEELGVLREKLRTSESEKQNLAEKIAAGAAATSDEEEISRLLAEEQHKNDILTEKLANFSAAEAEREDDGAVLMAENAELREALGTFKEKLRTSETERQNLADQISAELTSSEDEDRNDQERTQMQQMLDEAHQQNSILSEKLAVLTSMETELKEELSASRRQNDRLAERVETLALSHSELSRTETEKANNLLELREELNAAHHKISLLSAQGSEAKAANKRNNDLEELLLAKQVEVTNLTNDMQEFRRQASEQHKADVAALRIQMEGLREELAAESERRQEAEQQLTEVVTAQETDTIVEQNPVVETEPANETPPSVEVISPVAPIPTATEQIADIAAPKPKTEETGSSDLLPDDILNQWINN